MRIQKRLEAWQGAGLIDGGTAAAIARWEDDHAGGTRWAAWGIGAAGALAIMTGIVSVIAANWDVVPAHVKLLACGVLLLGSLAGVWLTRRAEMTWPRDLLLFFHGGMVLASLGCVAQIYHVHGHAWRAEAVAAALTIPAALIASRRLLTYVALAHVTALGWLVLDATRWFDDGPTLALVVAASALLLLSGSRAAHARLPVVASAMDRWAFGVAAGSATWACAMWRSPSDWYRDRGDAWSLALPAALLVAAALLQLRLQLAGRAGRTARVVALVSFLTLMLGGAAGARASSSSFVLVLAGFAVACTLCISVAIAAAAAGSRRGANLATGALAIRILALYLELAKDLMTTGFGLIATGLVCIGIAAAWWKLRHLVGVSTQSIEGGVS